MPAHHRAAQRTLPAVMSKAFAYGCILGEGALGPGYYSLYDSTTGAYVYGHPGYPLAVWENGTPHSNLWQAVENRTSERERAERGTDPLDTYEFSNATDWEWAAARATDPALLTAAALTKATGRVPSPERPHVLWAFYENDADRGILIRHVGPTWSSIEFPDAALDHDQWAEMFSVTGFTRDGEPAERPTAPIRLWRGSVPERRTDWSWTTDRETAHAFAHGGKGYRPRDGVLWTAVVPPSCLYANNESRSEAEWIAEVPDHLIVADAAPCGC